MKYCKLLLFSVLLSLFFSISAYCSDKVVVIDPGHGGEALGGNIDNRIERDINLITAQAFKERLELYDGVEVYITRTNNTDPDMDRKTRFKIAKSKKVDLFCSVHYNMSEYHTLYGTEVWAPMTGIEYAKSMEFATILNNDLASLGLFNRGVKHRESSDGGEYYGILKYGVDYSIPSVIIEHCHLDNENDSAFWSQDAYKTFGYTDADAVAKYFKLSSSTLGIDFSDYSRTTFEVPASAVRPDKTEPEYCNIRLDDFDSDNLTANITISASDSDGYIQYYSLSFDDGNTYGELIPWNGSDSSILTTTINLTPDTRQLLRCMVYNQYELTCESSSIELPYIELPQITEAPVYSDDPPQVDPQPQDNTVLYISIALLTLLVAIFISLLITLVIVKNRRKRRKNKRKKKHAPR